MCNVRILMHMAHTQSKIDVVMRVLVDTAGACCAISLAIWPEGFTDVLVWLQASRPALTSACSGAHPCWALTCATWLAANRPWTLYVSKSDFHFEQVHRPPLLTAVVVPLNSQGYEHADLLQRSLWLGHQVFVCISVAVLSKEPSALPLPCEAWLSPDADGGQRWCDGGPACTAEAC